MRIITKGNLWVVVAKWHGEDRVVFGPADLWDCLWYVASDA